MFLVEALLLPAELLWENPRSAYLLALLTARSSSNGTLLPASQSAKSRDILSELRMSLDKNKKSSSAEDRLDVVKSP